MERARVTLSMVRLHPERDADLPLPRLMTAGAAGMDVVAALDKIHTAGIRAVFLAFATPVGGADPHCFTPEDLPAMQAVHAEALAYCEANGIHLGYDCSFPLCVDERVKQTKCTSVPVMDEQGFMTICGGEYAYGPGKRHVTTFESLDDLHRYTLSIIDGLRTLPSRFDVCNECPEFNVRCHGMCLAYRDSSAVKRAPALPAVARS